jgi:hypothetical protein
MGSSNATDATVNPIWTIKRCLIPAGSKSSTGIANAAEQERRVITLPSKQDQIQPPMSERRRISRACGQRGKDITIPLRRRLY